MPRRMKKKTGLVDYSTSSFERKRLAGSLRNNTNIRQVAGDGFDLPPEVRRRRLIFGVIAAAALLSGVFFIFF